MRALSWPDLASGEIATAMPPHSLIGRAANWRPWGAYALMHLWLDGAV
jgi:3-methyladenine DNA glycosylase/8-oxoguanine DNA glycosylase